MKISSVSLVCLTVAAVFVSQVSAESERQISRPEVVRKLLSNARRLADDDGNDNYGDGALEAAGFEEVEAALVDFELKLLKCEGEVSLGMSDEGVLKYGVAIVRACPKNTCSSKTQGGCKKGHADFAIPLTDFVEAYIQDQADNMQWDDAQDMSNFAQCAAYNQDMDDQAQGESQYYVGPGCTSNGKDIKLAVFDDQYCQTESSTSFEEISNGWTLPFSDGGLVSSQCLKCSEEDGNGGYGLKEMCATFYEDAALRCEEWDISHYYWDSITEVYRFGKDKTGCKYIDWMDKSEPFSEWATIFFLSIMVIGSIAGAVYYTIWWKQGKYILPPVPTYTDIHTLTSHCLYFTAKANLEKIDDDDSQMTGQYKQHGDDESTSQGSGRPGEGGMLGGMFA